MSTNILKNTDFSLVSKYVTTDSKKRLRLSIPGTEGKAFRVFRNTLGQIVLDPVKIVPESESWLWENEDSIASVRRGLRQAQESAGHDLGSFAKHAKE